MPKTQLSDPLDDAELGRLGAFLGQFTGSMNLESMDGFFCALICAPQMTPMGNAMSQVWGDEAEFASDDEVQEIASLLMRHWNAVLRALDNDILYFPLLLEDAAGKTHANDWAQGFYRGMEASGGNWAELLGDEERGGCIVPILALAHEHDLDPEMRPGIIDDDRREAMVAGLKKIHEYFAPHRHAMAQEMATTQRRNAPKVGRNALCPCGSGRKYKHCCADLTRTLH